MSFDAETIMRIYQSSDGNWTKSLYEHLEQNHGARGIVAVNLFRALKTSFRAKQYRGGNGKGSYRSQAYARKSWSISNLCRELSQNPLKEIPRWGWGIDDKLTVHNHVLYVDLPTGQVSFHNEARADGPDYSGKWDGMRGASVGRICAWVAAVSQKRDIIPPDLLMAG